jgi:hypothetical protein
LLDIDIFPLKCTARLSIVTEPRKTYRHLPILTKPRKHMLRVGVYLPHLLHLVISLRDIFLVDTQCVDPQRFSRLGEVEGKAIAPVDAEINFVQTRNG